MSKCVVCLNEFQEHDILKLLPKCNHVFHLDCVDIWFQSNANCPLCRSAISGRNRYQFDRIVAPNSTPQDPQPLSIVESEEDFVVIELNRQQERSGSSRNLVQSNRTHSSKNLGCMVDTALGIDQEFVCQKNSSPSTYCGPCTRFSEEEIEEDDVV
ncbi:RING-H2 finger protein ATL1-like [Forsythia ovata]|uniref:RING-type E3 ubiquitin transferase n=1 Tax=Forsythia ovata TaxID=205694 RepID=A0ABD1W5R3_9LAMI